MASKLFVGNLNFKTTKEEVEQLFAQAGPLTDVFLPTDRETGRMRGFAFVTYQNDEDAAKAIQQFNGHDLSGRPLRVNAAEEGPRRTGPRPGAGGGGQSRGGGFAPPSNDWGGDSYGGGYGGGGGGGDDRFGGGKPNGSRRNVRAKKRSL